MDPILKRLLEAIAAPESGGRYNVRYTPKGGAEFSGYGQHPRIFEPGPAGPSSAAGKYQITATTYDRLGGGSFTPEAQDEMAARLAVQDYKARTNRDLVADLQAEGLSSRILGALSPTWTGLKDNPSKATTAYQAAAPASQYAAAGEKPEYYQQSIPSRAVIPQTMMASAQPTAAAAATTQPVYAQDLATTMRLIGSKIAPGSIDAPVPLTSAQQAASKVQQGRIADAGKSFAQLAALSAQRDPVEMLRQFDFQRRKPPVLQYPRGLL